MSNIINDVQRVAQMATQFLKDVPELNLGFEGEVRRLWNETGTEAMFQKALDADPVFQTILNQRAEEFIRLCPESHNILPVPEVKAIFISVLRDQADAFSDAVTIVA